MEGNRKILIVADDGLPTQELAQSIASVIVPPEFSGYSVSILKSDVFYGTDILPAHVFFLGCETPSPPSFSYIEILFDRINLAGRPCGVFSSGSKAIRYLSGLVRGSEASLGKPLLAKNGKMDEARLRAWVRNILAKGKGNA